MTCTVRWLPSARSLRASPQGSPPHVSSPSVSSTTTAGFSGNLSTFTASLTAVVSGVRPAGTRRSTMAMMGPAASGVGSSCSSMLSQRL